MHALSLLGRSGGLKVLCIGAHADDIEIGAGGAILTWGAAGVLMDVHWCVASAVQMRGEEARASAAEFLAGAGNSTVAIGAFRDAFFPHEGSKLKEWVESQKARMQPDVVLTHTREDAHQDHRVINELAWNAFRDSLILEFEVPKWDGDLGRPNLYQPLDESVMARKVSLLEKHFGSQRSRDWFDAETFRAMARLRGVECRARYAEAFHARKLVLG